MRAILLAGLLGGVAEIVWIALYGGLADANAAGVSREIIATVMPPLAGSPYAPAFGIAIHLVLSLAVAAAFALAVRGTALARSSAGVMALAVAVLGLVWMVNFRLVLPLWNPAFVTLLPAAVTLASKLLFGVAMGATLAAFAPRRRTHD